VRRAFQALLVAATLVAAVIPLPSLWVEHRYAQGVYLAWQRVATPASNALPFAAFDLIVVGLGLGLLTMWVRAVREARRGRRWTPVGVGAWRTAVLLAVVYLWFAGSWGLNYQRASMLTRLGVPARSPSTEAVEALGDDAVTRLNALDEAAHAEGWPAESERPLALMDGYAAVQRRLVPGAATAVAGRPKRTLFGPWFRWTSVDGMVDPFALEVLVNPDLLPVERPFVAAHEWGHLAGYADESEASFVGFLTCLEGGPAAEYSAWLALYWSVAAELPRASAERLAASLEPRPRADLGAIAARIQRGALPGLRRASWEVYDQYLRANRVEGGIRSYGLVIRLVVGTRPMWDHVAGSRQ